jgi:hypothetical protein
LDFIRQGTKKPQSTKFKAAPPLEKLLETSSDIFEPKERVYGKGIVIINNYLISKAAQK